MKLTKQNVSISKIRDKGTHEFSRLSVTNSTTLAAQPSLWGTSPAHSTKVKKTNDMNETNCLYIKIWKKSSYDCNRFQIALFILRTQIFEK